MRENEKTAVWKKSARDMFETFAVELEEFTRTGKEPSRGSQDVQYALELQKRRLKDKGLVMKYDFLPRGHFYHRRGAAKNWSDERYTSKLEYRTCRVERKVYQDQKKIFDKGYNAYFYQTITDIGGQRAAEEEHLCPNCGAVSPIRVLEDGCPYCGTFFKMTDLFPKVTGFYFVRDVSGTQTELKQSILKIAKPLVIAFSILLFLAYLGNPDMNRSILLCAVVAVLGGSIFGGILGYVLWAVRMLASMFWTAGKGIPMLFNAAGSGKRFISQMKRYSPEISFEYFTGKVVSILKMILFSEDAGELTCYAGAPLGGMFDNLIDSSFSGAVALKRFSVKEGRCYVTVEVYMEDLYEDGGSVRAKDEKFRMSLYRSLRKPIDLHFSIKAMHCQSCGKSFDATKERCCPSCGTQHEMADEDWVVTEIRRR